MKAELQHMIAMKFRAFELLRGQKTPACKWKDPANWKSPTNMPSSDWVRWGGWGAVATKFAAIDFDEDKSRAVFPEGVLHHFCQVDGLDFNKLADSGFLLRTPHGYHLLVREDPAIDQGQGFTLPDGKNSYIDVRAQGKGYIVGPGTVIDGQEYAPACGWDVWKSRIEAIEMPWLNQILPSVYAIVTHQQTNLVTSDQKPKTYSLRRGISERREYDGTSTWTPDSFEAGLQAVATAAPGKAHGIMCGLMRALRARSNNPGFEHDVERAVEACQHRRIPQREIDDALRDFVYSHIEKNKQAAEAAAAQRVGDAIEKKKADFILTDKNVIVSCEANILEAVRCGYIRIDDYTIDAYGSLIWLPRRELGRKRNDTPDAILYDSESEMVCRIDRFLRAKAGTSSRSHWLPAVAREVEKSGREELAHDFLEDVRSCGQTVSIAELVAHMSIGGDVDQATRWIEVCLLQSLRRMLRPASPLENILILWGAQRTRKSTFISALFDPSFISPLKGNAPNSRSYVDTYTGDLRDEAAVGQRLLGKFCVELPEMTAMRRTSDIGMIRDVITRTHDSYRAPYATKPVKQPRTSTFVCTANESPSFGDQYGNRRFCPINIAGKIDNDWISSHRVEIWRGLFVELQDDPERAILTDDEQSQKEKELESGMLDAIPYFGEICDALRSATNSTREHLPLTEITSILTTDDKGPRLHNTKQLKDAVCDVMRHLGAARRRGRYPSFVVDESVRQKLAAWMKD